MRDGLLGLDQAARDGGAHAVERHLLELDALVERLDLRGRCAGRLRRRAPAALGDGGFDVGATMRPRGPEPDRRDRSMPLSPASRRASGVTTVPPRGPGRTEVARRRAHLEERIERAGRLHGARAAGSAAKVAGGAFGAAGGGAFAAVAAGALAVAPPSPAITATTAPTSAVSPACTLISVSVPAVIDGTSIDTLSVSISNRLSPGFTASPADLNHFVILPSATVSPSCGIKRPLQTHLKRSHSNLSCPAKAGMTPRRYQLTEMYCVSRNSFSPSCAPSRPMPDCFMPPNGAAGSETRPRFKPIMPKSSFSETRMPRPRSLV